MPKFYFSIIPINNLIESNIKADIKKCHYENALRAQKLNIRQQCYNIALDLFLEGECFYYKIETSKGILYQKLPNSLCQPLMAESINNNEIIRILFDMKKLNDDTVQLYPSEIINAYERYKFNPGSDEFMGGFYLVSNKAVGFLLDKNKRGVPPFLYIFESIIDIKDKKIMQDEIDMVNSIKMIHNEMPTKDGKPVMDITFAQMFNEAIKNALEEYGLKSVFSMTNPMKSQIFNLDTSNSNNRSLLKNAKTNFYDEVGTTEYIFNSDKGGAEAIKRSIIEDSARALIRVMFLVENYFSFELSNGVKGFVKYKVSMKEVTQHNEIEKSKQSKEELAFGYSVLEHYANLGHTPLEAINLILLERELGIKDWLVPIKSSHTQSGNNSNDNGGNKSADEMREDGEMVSDTTEAKESSGNDYS